MQSVSKIHIFVSKKRFMSKKQQPSLQFFRIEDHSPLRVDYAVNGFVHAGFPTPVDDAFMQKIDLNKILMSHPATTFLAKVQGDSMIDAGVSDGDLLVVDRSLRPTEKSLNVCCIDGEFALKRIERLPDKLILHANNPEYKPIEVTSEMDFQVWGVVTYCIKKTF